jgi:hypothetical protein
MINEILKKINKKKLIELNEFSKNISIDKAHAEWLINDLITKGYIKKNKLHCGFHCEETDSKDVFALFDDKELKMYLELTEKGRKIIP